MLKKQYTYPDRSHRQGKEQEQYIYLDIETTGLSRDRTILYLIGCGYYEQHRLHILQWFNDDGVSEEQILQELQDFLSSKNGILFTFNGEGFDLPYLKRHYALHALPCSLDDYPSYDLYKTLKLFQPLFLLSHGRQKDWEKFLGVSREDSFHGGQLISIYKEYLRTKKEDILSLLLLHNEEDILGMTDLYPLTSYGQLLSEKLTFAGVSFASLDETPDQGYLTIQGCLPEKVPKSLCLRVPLSLQNEKRRTPSDVSSEQNVYPFQLHVEEAQVRLTLPVFDDTLYYFYPDYRNYFYLPKEDRAVHKSIGCYVDQQYRQKATPQNCYIRKEGLFLPLPLKQKYKGIQVLPSAYQDRLTLYHFHHKERYAYVDVRQLFEEEHSPLLLYFSDWIKTLLIEGCRQHT